MAPKTKKGETRMDAALDAMHLYGFSRKLVRTTVQSLLKVYGGNEGWVFIEDSSYTLLIETLLEKQANPSPQDGLIEANPGDGPNEVTTIGCSNSALLPCCKAQTSDDTPLTNQVMDNVSVASETPIGAVTISAEKNSACQPAENLAWRENHGPKSPQLVTRLNHKRRRPCYGWISSDEEDEENLIELKPSLPM